MSRKYKYVWVHVSIMFVVYICTIFIYLCMYYVPMILEQQMDTL